jgi:NitT/TauT family transport system permease protein
MKGWQRRWVLPILPIVIFIAAWQVLCTLDLINQALFPAPSRILNELVALHRRELPARSLLLAHVGATIGRLLIASVAGSVLGIVFGTLMGVFRPVSRFFDPLIAVLMPVPGIAMAPLFIVWFGFGNPTIVSLGILATFFPLAYNTAAGVRSVDRQLVRAARLMGASQIATLHQVFLPWAAGYVLVGLRLGLARCWRTIVAVEFIAAANWGLGYMIWDAAEYLRAPLVYGGIALLISLFFIVDRLLIRSLERATLERWGMSRSASA